MQDVFRIIGRLSRSSISVLITANPAPVKNWSLMPCIATVASQSAIYRAEYGGYPEGFDRSELFGHEKGAFTGANTIRQGVLNRPMAARYFSTKLVICRGCADAFAARAGRRSVLSRWRYAPVKVDVRIIAATHQNLERGCRKVSSVRICSTA